MRSPRLLLRWLLVALACLGLGLSVYSWLTIEVPPGDLLRASLLGHDTVFSQGYSEREFKDIKAGMTHEEVSAVLGQPLDRRDVPPKHAGFLVRGVPQNRVDEIWWYSRSRAGDNRTRAGNNFWRRAVFFDQGRVCGKYDDFYLR